MQWTVLGTSGMVPTKERNLTAHFLKYKGEGILFDCGEGTQRQMNICGIKRTDVTKILITHWHGDHVVGLLGLIQTLGDEESPPSLEIFGPRDTSSFMQHMMRACAFTQNVKIKIHDLDPKDVEVAYDSEDYQILVCPGDHSVPCVSYAFLEKDHKNIDVEKMKKMGIPSGPHLASLKDGKTITVKGKKINPEEIIDVTPGKKIAYVTDTRPTEFAVKLADEAEMLVSEAVYTSDLQKNAEKYKHMTAREAALLASRAGVKKLVLSHFSQRFKNSQDIEDEARVVFDNLVCAHDFMRFEL